MKNEVLIQLSRPQLPKISEYKKLLDRIWQTGQVSNFGYYAQEMERVASELLGTKNVSVVSSCDIGLIIALSALKLKKGDEVILSPFTFNSTANSILWNNLKPVFSDIDINTLCIDPVDVKKKITSKTKVVIGTHVFGNPCDADKLRGVIGDKNIKLIFDSAQAFGSIYKNRIVGTLGDIEVFSFSGTKTVVSGEGGMIVTKDEKQTQLVKLLRNFGFAKDYNTQVLGINGKISEFNAALGCLSMKNTRKSLVIRNKIAEIYRQGLTGVGDIQFQKIENGNKSTYKDFCLLTSKRDLLSYYLKRFGIETRNYFFPINKTDYFKKYFTPLKNVDYITQRNICIPIFNEITLKQQNYVISKIKEFYKYEN